MIKIKTVVFDVDGVFTIGFLYDENETNKIFGAHDTDGLKLLKENKIEFQAISADHRDFEITKKRMYDLGVKLSLVSEKSRIDFIKSMGDPAEICFMGDGHFDALVFDQVGYSVAPCNAVPVPRSKANYVTQSKGGGAVYEAVLHILSLFKVLNEIIFKELKEIAASLEETIKKFINEILTCKGSIIGLGAGRMGYSLMPSSCGYHTWVTTLI